MTSPICIDARGLRKTYGNAIALDGFGLQVEQGTIVGIVGPNGAGKSTALGAILGLVDVSGELHVLGRDPRRDRTALMRDVAFIADIAVLPRWMRVSQALDFMAGVHPRFDRARAEALLAITDVPVKARVGELSKGMAAQVHLALVMAIDASLLILDEPTLGLDPHFRKQFFDSLLAEFFDETRTVLIATHQVEEVQDILTDVVFLERGQVIMHCTMDEYAARYTEVRVRREHVAAARALHPLREREAVGHNIFLFAGAAPADVRALGDVRTPSLSDMLVALSDHTPGDSRGDDR